MDNIQLGKLVGMMEEIKKNTDKIPDLAVKVAVHETRLNSIVPKVEAHEISAQRAIGVSGACGTIFGIVAGVLTSMVRGN